VHVLLQIFSDAPQTHVSIFVALIQACLYVVVAQLLVCGVLLHCGQPLHDSHFPEESVAILRRNSEFPSHAIVDYSLLDPLYFADLVAHLLVFLALSLGLDR
jgi:hypothetical protein